MRTSHLQLENRYRSSEQWNQESVAIEISRQVKCVMYKPNWDVVLLFEGSRMVFRPCFVIPSVLVSDFTL